MKKTIYVGGSAANPPHKGHLAMIKLMLNFLKGEFEIIWIPSGARVDKPKLADATDRKVMTEMLFEDIDDARFHIDYTDLESGLNRPTIEILEQLKFTNPDTDIIWYTGVDSVIDQEIKLKWIRGNELWEKWTFLILPRSHYPDPHTMKLPKQFEILDCKGFESELLDLASSKIVSLIQAGQPWEYLYGGPDKPIVRYIKNHHLYGWKG